MVAEIISVGTEILLGNIVNTNAAYLSEQCALLGINCYYQDVVGDNRERIMGILRTALERADVLLIGGGLGPTPDDLTKETCAEVLGKQLYMDEAVKTSILDFFNRKGITPASNNFKQALVPEGAVVLENPNGTAPGLILEANGKHLILLPGPPNELVPMFEEKVKPYLQNLVPGTIYSKMVKLCGVGESAVAEQIADLIEGQTNPTIATYAKTGEVHLRVTAKAEDEKAAKQLVKPMVKELKERFGNHIYSTENDTTLEKAVVDLLLANKLTVATAESCTGGLLAGRLINVAGVSDVFKNGLITYSNKSKHRLLGVKKKTLEKHGAVSKETAEEMAKGLAALTKADVAVSVTGIAGPDGGTDKKPVGLIYISCSVCGKTTTREFTFTGNRAKVREASVAAGLNLMRESILEYYSKEIFGS
ncbi:MAG: competence/damage-inducible protein A [Lachnospiraceae bacterium]|nr:competence/damage-inducible protein A [Lachnospiraceae bacterium]